MLARFGGEGFDLHQDDRCSGNCGEFGGPAILEIEVLVEPAHPPQEIPPVRLSESRSLNAAARALTAHAWVAGLLKSLKNGDLRSRHVTCVRVGDGPVPSHCCVRDVRCCAAGARPDRHLQDGACGGPHGGRRFVLNTGASSPPRSRPTAGLTDNIVQQRYGRSWLKSAKYSSARIARLPYQDVISPSMR